MDRAYEGDETRQLVMELNMIPVVPPKSNRCEPWEYDRELYKKRNQIERLFRRLKGFRRIFSRFETSTWCFWPSSISHSSSRLCDSVNSPSKNTRRVESKLKVAATPDSLRLADA